MKKTIIMVTLIMSMVISGHSQSLNSVNGNYPKKEKINGKKFHVAYYEHEIEKSIDEVWQEVSGNYIHVGKIAKPITESSCESGDLTEGIGAKRFCAIDFNGRNIEVKEEIIDEKITKNRREFTYVVYESIGFPAKVYNTWIVRRAKNGKTYLGTVFKMRANFAPMTGMMINQLKKKGNIRSGVLAYKHYLETGEKKVAPETLLKLYPEQI